MRYDADGERWDVYVSEETPRDGQRSIIFHCSSNTSFGWRIAEAPAGDYASDDDLAQADLDELYARSQPFDYARDPAAHEDHIGDDGAR